MPERDENWGESAMIGLVNRRRVYIVMSLNDGADFVGFVVRNGEMKRISNGSINTGDFFVVVWVIGYLCFGVGLNGDVSRRMSRMGRITKETGASDSTEVVLTGNVSDNRKVKLKR